jgi:general secretion pathway protein A
MYLQHFGLSTYPFSTAPDPRFYFPSAKHREALACLLYSIEQRKGFALITGAVGCGKSMLCRTALERLGRSVEAAMVAHTSLAAREFLQAIIAEFRLTTRTAAKVQVLGVLKDFLIRARREGRNPVLIVDEAQDLAPNVLEEVRLLGNLETSTEKLLQIILVGQPELRHKIGTYQLRQLDQRIAVKFHLGTLCEEDVNQYIDHRLRVAGAADADLFDPEAKAAAFKVSAGVPRMVNILCDQALLQAYVADERRVSGQIMRRVIADREGYYLDRPAQVLRGEVSPGLVRGSVVIRKASFKCPQCDTKVGIYEDEAGESGICPGCGSMISIPKDAFEQVEAEGPADAPQGPGEAAGGALSARAAWKARFGAGGRERSPGTRQLGT